MEAWRGPWGKGLTTAVVVTANGLLEEEEGRQWRLRLPQSSLSPACHGPGQRSGSRVLRPVALGPGLFQAPEFL